MVSLFSDIVRFETRRKLYHEPEYTYLDRSARPEASHVRSLYDSWFGEFPEEHRKALASAFRSTLDHHFLAASFELYLHAVLRRLMAEVEVHPAAPDGRSKRPDFLAIEQDGSRVYVEATLATDESEEVRASERRKAAVYDVIDQLEIRDFFLDMDMRGAPKTPVPTRQLRAELTAWIATLDADAINREFAATGRSGRPAYSFAHDGWHITFRVIPKSPKARGRPRARAIGVQAFGVSWSSTWEAIRDAVGRKATRYGDLAAPFIVAVNVGHFSLDLIDIMEALFGKEQFLVSIDAPDREPEMERAPNGLWWGPKGPQNRGVSAVLVAADVMPWTVAVCEVVLVHNPWAHYPYKGALCALPQRIPGDGVMVEQPGRHPREILGLPETWPDE